MLRIRGKNQLGTIQRDKDLDYREVRRKNAFRKFRNARPKREYVRSLVAGTPDVTHAINLLLAFILVARFSSEDVHSVEGKDIYVSRNNIITRLQPAITFHMLI